MKPYVLIINVGSATSAVDCCKDFYYKNNSEDRGGTHGPVTRFHKGVASSGVFPHIQYGSTSAKK